ncbi:glycosyltransferase family 39 protein [Streptomyces sp. BR123]|uniref:ArnT family glycosyltransferase n=1 Tax=Streptomyces sp. BR123 TaxID=2749828 RepID=UPI0015C4522E|nr:glycosyltransferase family 39 protein [Streptomyces sp. BR123]NXY94871.1 glycosyltransferase family 39 protein [Streptomyces sp. BR123]
MTTAVPPIDSPFPERAAAPHCATTRTTGAGSDSGSGPGSGARPAAVPRPRWELPALVALLLATAVLLLWNLSASGYANSFYSAAVQAGSESWKAFFFGSSDAGNSITVDKPPAALWPMALSVRLFGLGSWQILVPQALMGVVTTAVLYAAVRRHFGPAAGLIGGAVFTLTPVAALMFRFNNPDALLTLLLTVTVYCVLRALDGARTAWLVGAGAAIGFAFLTKTLQAFVILPPLVLVYAVCAPTRLRRRLGQLLLAGVAVIVAGGWWVAIVELWPAASRPYIGGSQTNSFLELTLGYNGLGRINGNETGSVGGGGRPGGGGGWGETGIDRLFSANIGGQISWLLPAALIMLVAGLVITWRAGRAADTIEGVARAAFLAWGGALLITAAVFSWMQGIFHEYYTVALAPFVAALVGMGAAVLWEERGSTPAALTLSGTLALTAWWSYVLLGRSPGYLPWLRWAVLAAGLAAAAGLLLGLLLGARLGRRAALGAAALGLGAALAGPLAYCLTTVGSGHAGSIVTAGPAVQGARAGMGMRPFGGGELPSAAGLVGGGPGGGSGGGLGGGLQDAVPRGMPGGPGNVPQRAPQGMPGGGGQVPGGQDGRRGAGGRDGGAGRGGQSTGGVPGAPGVPGGGGGGMGGLLGGTEVDKEATAALRKDADRYTWAAAAVGAQNAASYQLASGEPVMPIGGFNGSDPSPTLAGFQEYVKAGKVHYFIASGSGAGGAGGAGGEGPGMRGGAAVRGGPGGSTSSAIETWVKANFRSVLIGGATFYDLTAPLSASSAPS